MFLCNMKKIKFNHFLITMFNLKGISSELSHKDWECWNMYRFDFFQKYTLPSVLNQSNKNFKWLIYFDASTPKNILEKIKLLNIISFIHIKFEDGIDSFMSNYSNTIKSYINDKSQWVITSRMDSDDALHKDVIKTIQQNFFPKNGQIISFASGYTFDIKLKKMSHYYYFKSPFLSIIEKIDSKHFKGIYYYGHTKWPGIEFSIIREIKVMLGKRRILKPIYLIDKPYWVQFIHNNVSNSYYRGLPVIKTINLKDFALEITNRKEAWYNFYQFYSYSLWKRYFKAIVYKFLLKIYTYIIS